MQYNKRKIILFGSLFLVFGTLSVVFFLFSDRSPAIKEEISFIVTSDSIENSVRNSLSNPIETLSNYKEFQEDTLVGNTPSESLGEVLAAKDEFIHLDQVKGKHLIIIGTFKQKDNALTLKDQTIEKGHEQCQIIHDNGGALYWVVFNVYDNLKSAKTDNDKYKLEGWIKKM